MNFLFTADWHIRNTIPLKRFDDFLSIQKKTIENIYDIAIENDAIVIIAGDIFHIAKEKCPQELLVFLLRQMKRKKTYFISGNHDLLFHNIGNIDISTIGVLNEAFSECNNFMNLKIKLDLIPFGLSKKNQTNNNNKMNIGVFHEFCTPNNSLPSYIKKGITAKELCETGYDIIVIGDNHQKFVYKKNNQIVFCPGCITRQKISEKDYKPSVYLFSTLDTQYKEILLPDQKKDIFCEDNFCEELSSQIEINNDIEIDDFYHLCIRDAENISSDVVKKIEEFINE